MKYLFTVVAAFVVSTTLPAAEIPDRDQRNVVIRHTDTKFEMPEYRSLRRWKERAAALRERVPSYRQAAQEPRTGKGAVGRRAAYHAAWALISIRPILY